MRPNTDVFFEAGQDWTIFGSSALMNLFETTFYGAYWGNVYERAPQMRLGFVEKLGGSRNWKISPEFALMMPSEGNLPARCHYLYHYRARCTPQPARSSTDWPTSWDTASVRVADAARPDTGIQSRIAIPT